MLLSRLEFGSLFTYTSKPKNDEQREAQTLAYSLKTDRLIGSPPIPLTLYTAKYIFTNITSLPFGNFFGPDVTLVPVPSHGLRSRGALWVPENLAKALEAQNLGRVVTCAERKIAVQKSATSKPEERPKPIQHYQSIFIQKIQPITKEVVLVDDVITRGSTAIGVASKLKEAYPWVSLKIFAAIRVMSPSDSKMWIDPCIGKIEVIGEQAFRSP